MIHTDDRAVLEPLLRSALEHEKGFVQIGIARTRQQIKVFEQRYGMSSSEFERRLNALDLAETPEFSDWRMEIGLLRLLERQHIALQNAHFN